MRRHGVRSGVAAAVLAALALGAGLGGVGCVVGDEPEEQCFALLDQICERYTACRPPVTLESCREMFGPYMPCDRAIAVSARYDECMQAVEALDCAAFSSGDGLPDVCHDVILVTE